MNRITRDKIRTELMEQMQPAVNCISWLQRELTQSLYREGELESRGRDLEKALKEIQDFLKWVEPAYKNAEIDKRMLVKYLNAIGGMTRKALGIDPTEAPDG